MGNFNFPNINLDFYIASSPVLILCVFAIVAMLQSVFKSIGSERAVFRVTIGSLIAALVASFAGTPPLETPHLFGSYLAGDLSRFGQVVILAVAIVTTGFFNETRGREKFFRGEIASLFLIVVAGMCVLVASEDLITIFVGLEMSSIGLYTLVGYVDPDRRSLEGAVKYFILGAFSAAMLLFGFGLLYAGTGSLQINNIVAALPKVADHFWILLGGLFILVGLGFKLALVPFHLWAPDAYEAAPTGITAYMATTVKVMVLILSARLFAGSFYHLYEVWAPGIAFLAMLSMIFGNIMALVQTSLKRMLAYSSIAHSGYLAIALASFGGSAGELPLAAILFYIVGYSIISMGTFGILMWLEGKSHSNLLLEDLTGLAKSHPFAAFALATFMFAFAGMPPTVGFISKFFVFNAALSQQLYSLVVIGVIGSTISMFYYLRVIVRMYMTEPSKVSVPLDPQRSLLISAVVVASVVFTLLLGTVLPGPAMKAIMNTSHEIALNLP